jgi:hypothetical protein
LKQVRQIHGSLDGAHLGLLFGFLAESNGSGDKGLFRGLAMLFPRKDSKFPCFLGNLLLLAGLSAASFATNERVIIINTIFYIVVPIIFS